MPTARSGSGAVHIPGVGELVVGGWGNSGGRLRTAELLRGVEVGDGEARVWREVVAMNKPVWKPSVVYLNGSVIVVSQTCAEMLSLPGGYPGQWTLLSGCIPPNNRPYSMVESSLQVSRKV